MLIEQTFLCTQGTHTGHTHTHTHTHTCYNTLNDQTVKGFADR